jgi:hypothetical protein
MLAPIANGETKSRPSRAAAEITVVAKVVAAFFMAPGSDEGAGIKVAE